MQTVLEQGSIDKPLTFDVGLIQLSFIPVCSLNTCNISVKLCPSVLFIIIINNNYYYCMHMSFSLKLIMIIINKLHNFFAI